MGKAKKCIKFVHRDGKVTVIRDNIELADDIPSEDLGNYIERLEKEAKSKGKTWDNYLDELSISRIDDAIKDLGIEIKVPKNTLSVQASLKKMENIVSNLKGGSKRFNPQKKKLKELGILLKRTKTGLCVDFEGTKYLYPITGKQKNIVKIKLTGHDNSDFKLANKLAGFDGKPKDYTWHHLDDYDPIDGTCTMQLVEKDIHKASCPHYGGVKVLEDFLNFKYLSRL